LFEIIILDRNEIKYITIVNTKIEIIIISIFLRFFLISFIIDLYTNLIYTIFKKKFYSRI